MARRRFPFGILARGIALGGLALLFVFAGLVALYTIAPPVSTLMLGRKVVGRSYERIYVRLADIAPVAVASVIASEDARFCQNDGVEWGALHEVLSGAGKYGPKRGASTITMQTAKNLFLWPSRSAIRKGIEIPVALVLGKVWSKAYTVEVYLNIAEWGDGLFGIEAAAQHYFHKRASQLDAHEAALLATSLPNPIKRDAAHPRLFQRILAASIVKRARDSTEWLNCLPQ
ncbi:MAG: transglycosylase domain-containing protein [Beijerinckiaceae bacterium]